MDSNIKKKDGSLKTIQELTGEELLNEYNGTRNRIIDGGFGERELNYFEELIRELDSREGA